MRSRNLENGLLSIMEKDYIPGVSLAIAREMRSSMMEGLDLGIKREGC